MHAQVVASGAGKLIPLNSIASLGGNGGVGAIHIPLYEFGIGWCSVRPHAKSVAFSFMSPLGNEITDKQFLTHLSERENHIVNYLLKTRVQEYQFVTGATSLDAVAAAAMFNKLSSARHLIFTGGSSIFRGLVNCPDISVAPSDANQATLNHVTSIVEALGKLGEPVAAPSGSALHSGQLAELAKIFHLFQSDTSLGSIGVDWSVSGKTCAVCSTNEPFLEGLIPVSGYFGLHLKAVRRHMETLDSAHKMILTSDPSSFFNSDAVSHKVLYSCLVWNDTSVLANMKDRMMAEVTSGTAFRSSVEAGIQKGTDYISQERWYWIRKDRGMDTDFESRSGDDMITVGGAGGLSGPQISRDVAAAPSIVKMDLDCVEVEEAALSEKEAEAAVAVQLLVDDSTIDEEHLQIVLRRVDQCPGREIAQCVGFPGCLSINSGGITIWIW